MESIIENLENLQTIAKRVKKDANCHIQEENEVEINSLKIQPEAPFKQSSTLHPIEKAKVLRQWLLDNGAEINDKVDIIISR